MSTRDSPASRGTGHDLASDGWLAVDGQALAVRWLTPSEHRLRKYHGDKTEAVYRAWHDTSGGGLRGRDRSLARRRPHFLHGNAGPPPASRGARPAIGLQVGV